jgi:hypothetical protein
MLKEEDRCLLSAGRCHVRFIWVNDRSPSSHSACAVCARSIGSTYLRDIETRLCYCDPGCYASVRPNKLGSDPFVPDPARAAADGPMKS